MRFSNGLSIFGILALLFMVAIFQNCGAYQAEQLTQSSAKSESENKDLEELASEIEAKASVFCQSSADCKAVGLGERLCGGPDDALVYSNEGEDERQLLGLVNAYNSLAKEHVRSLASSGVVGTCVIAEIPESFQCIDNVCVGSR